MIAYLPKCEPSCCLPRNAKDVGLLSNKYRRTVNYEGNNLEIFHSAGERVDDVSNGVPRNINERLFSSLVTTIIRYENFFFNEFHHRAKAYAVEEKSRQRWDEGTSDEVSPSFFLCNLAKEQWQLKQSFLVARKIKPVYRC